MTWTSLKTLSETFTGGFGIEKAGPFSLAVESRRKPECGCKSKMFRDGFPSILEKPIKLLLCSYNRRVNKPYENRTSAHLSNSVHPSTEN